jgi:hypothetical protein
LPFFEREHGDSEELGNRQQEMLFPASHPKSEFYLIYNGLRVGLRTPVEALEIRYDRLVN